MILGYAHTTICVDNRSSTNIKALVENSLEHFRFEEKLINTKEKKTLMKDGSEWYDFILDLDNKIEYLIYPMTNKSKNLITVKKDHIHLSNIKIEELNEFWLDFIGLTATEDGKYIFNSLIPNWSIEFEIKCTENSSSEYSEVFLDTQGPIALAFYVKRIELVKEGITEMNIDTTSIFDVQIHGKHMKVFFVKLKSGIYCEFIEVQV